MSTSSYRLLYFNGRGTAERTRLLFALAKQPYEDVRFDQDEFAKAKTDGSLAAGLNRVPLLQVVCEDGTTTNIPQSKAIERFVAKQFGLNGADALAEGVIDGICEHQRDVRESFAKVDTLPAGAEKDTAVQAWLEKDLPDWLQKVLGQLGRFVGMPKTPHDQRTTSKTSTHAFSHATRSFNLIRS